MNITQRPIFQKGQRPAAVKLIRDDARGRDCTLMIPGVCCHDPARTVGCHMRFFGFAGMGQKPDDIFILDACDCCHAVFDSRKRWAEAALGWDDVLRAFMTTLANRRAAGLIQLARA
ncbi:DUF1364 family protein [Salipiger sp. 1_MG-2023]|uniref:nuclease domain-containing protein n=1 Tax=Salipiger sp. 1_MG-2023 TaxID=3062665 RepID=UPI0026E27E98|nr:nuclease domain-containing protein [Salipiger sp. 1_MG-2023]MDO6587366.1 DUF1364 family protein [Salipiger sp. 1_MG-2023]